MLATECYFMQIFLEKNLTLQITSEATMNVFVLLLFWGAVCFGNTYL